VKTEGGKITEVVVAEAPAPAEEVAVAAEIAPDTAVEIVEEVKEGYPTLDPAMVEEIVKKHLVSIMEELKAAYTELGSMKEKMAAFASQMETMTDIVEKVAELPTETPKPTASAIVEQRKAASMQNFNALAQAIQTLKKSN
jgi:5'-deoxynucleotidase YfbR-like HD superfamily hydrolase